jgi:hypothetical protein
MRNVLEHQREMKPETAKRTAVEWLKYVYENQGEYVMDDQWKKALEMEKEQIIDAHFEGQNDETDGCSLYISEQYYNETYNTNEK